MEFLLSGLIPLIALKCAGNALIIVSVGVSLVGVMLCLKGEGRAISVTLSCACPTSKPSRVFRFTGGCTSLSLGRLVVVVVILADAEGLLRWWPSSGVLGLGGGVWRGGAPADMLELNCGEPAPVFPGLGIKNSDGQGVRLLGPTACRISLPRAAELRCLGRPSGELAASLSHDGGMPNFGEESGAPGGSRDSGAIAGVLGALRTLVSPGSGRSLNSLESLESLGAFEALEAVNALEGVVVALNALGTSGTTLGALCAL